MTNLSTKELNYLKDFMSWELLLAKKCNQYATQEVDPQYQGIFHHAGQTHQQNFLNLLNYLQTVVDGQKRGGMQ